MAETINDRIEMLVNERFDGNKAAFAKSIGLPPTGMSSYLSKQRRSKPSVDMVTKSLSHSMLMLVGYLLEKNRPKQRFTPRAITRLHLIAEMSQWLSAMPSLLKELRLLKLYLQKRTNELPNSKNGSRN